MSLPKVLHDIPIVGKEVNDFVFGHAIAGASEVTCHVLNDCAPVTPLIGQIGEYLRDQSREARIELTRRLPGSQLTCFRGCDGQPKRITLLFKAIQKGTFLGRLQTTAGMVQRRLNKFLALDPCKWFGAQNGNSH